MVEELMMTLLTFSWWLRSSLPRRRSSLGVASCRGLEGERGLAGMLQRVVDGSKKV